MLRRLGVSDDVRLACQLRPISDLTVTPLLPATATTADGRPPGAAHNGREQEVVVLFADLRRFTRLAEHRLPYDVVFFLITVHAASRLEALTKDYDCELVVSEAVARRAGVSTVRLPRHELTLRNRAEPLAVLVVQNAIGLAPTSAGSRAGSGAPRATA